MLRISVLLLASLLCGALASSPIVDIQEQFGEQSHDFEFVLQKYRAKNSHVRSEVLYRILDGLGNLTVEMRDITADYWVKIETHQYASEECLEMVRPDFVYYVEYASLDIQDMAEDLDRLVRQDANYRFNPTVSFAQRENGRAVYQTVQTLGRNQFLANMVDTVAELQDELEYYQHLRETLKNMLDHELEDVEGLWNRVEEKIEWWHEFTVGWHHVFMTLLLARVEFNCAPDVIEVNGAILPPIEASSAMLKKVQEKLTFMKV